MSDKLPDIYGFPPRDHLECSVRADFEAKSPKQLLDWVFHRYVPNPEFYFARSEIDETADDHVTYAARVLTSDYEPDWEEVVALTAAFGAQNDMTDAL